MTGSACPSCGARVNTGDPWCTLCWTDLRPKPAAVAAPEPVTVAAPAVVTAPPAPPAPAAPAAPPVDPLTAPLAAVLAGPVAADPAAPSVPTWPCVECGARNPIDASACGTCATPFGGRIARLDNAKELRQRRLLLVVGVVVAFLAAFAGLMLVTTKAPPKNAPHVEVTLGP